MVVFAGALLENAEELLRMGLSPSEVVEGYDMACRKALEILPSEYNTLDCVMFSLLPSSSSSVCSAGVQECL